MHIYDIGFNSKHLKSLIEIIVLKSLRETFRFYEYNCNIEKPEEKLLSETDNQTNR